MSELKLEVKKNLYSLQVGVEKRAVTVEKPAKVLMLRTVELVREVAVGASRIFEFQFNNVASQVIYTFQQNGYVVDLEAEITTPFNGSGASLSIGTTTNPQLLLGNNEIDVSQLMSSGKSSNVAFSTSDEVRLFLTPGSGATQGAGRIILEVI